MDSPTQFENLEPEKNESEDLSTRRIEPSELNPVVEPETSVESAAETVVIKRAEESAATKVISNVQNETPPAPKPVETPKLIAPPTPPAAASTPPAPQKDNRTPIIVIIAVAAVAVVCICACTLVILVSLAMVPNF
jgi:hypothetical protein